MQSTSTDPSNPQDENGLEQISVIVSGQGAQRRKRFTGKLLVRWLQATPNEEGSEVLSVYRTARKQFAVHTRTLAEWDFSEGDPDYWGNPKNWGVKSGFLQKLMGFGWDWETFKESGDYSLQIFKTLEDLKGHVSQDLYRTLSQALEVPETDDLDI